MPRSRSPLPGKGWIHKNCCSFSCCSKTVLFILVIHVCAFTLGIVVSLAALTSKEDLAKFRLYGSAPAESDHLDLAWAGERSVTGRGHEDFQKEQAVFDVDYENNSEVDHSITLRQKACNKFAIWHGVERIMNEGFLTRLFSDNALAATESEGFFDEPRHTWMLRKQAHEYQMCVQDLDRILCIPNADWKLPANHFWQICYEPSFNCALEQRIGPSGEGGKWVCDPWKIAAQVAAGKKCLIYSIGSEGDYGFEIGMQQAVSASCEIHIFDREHWDQYTVRGPPGKMKYHVYTVGKPPSATPVSRLVEDLGHVGRTIDIFKIDCEGCEFDSYRSWFGSGVYIRQILIEVHGDTSKQWGMQANEFFNFLLDLGYVIFHKEPNIQWSAGDAMCVEISFLKLSPSFSRGGGILRNVNS